MLLKIYDGGKVVDNYEWPTVRGSLPGSGLIEMQAADGRTLQVVFDEEGRVHIRGWGNIPGKVGNMDRFSVHGSVAFEEPDTCDICFNRLEHSNDDQRCHCNDPDDWVEWEGYHGAVSPVSDDTEVEVELVCGDIFTCQAEQLYWWITPDRPSGIVRYRCC